MFSFVSWQDWTPGWMMVNGWIIISHHSLRWTLSFADFTLQDIKERRRWEDDRAPKMYHSSDPMPLGSSTAIDSCINCMLYRDILKFHRLMIAGMRGSGVGSSVRECLSLEGDRFLAGPPPTQCFLLVSWQGLDLAGSVNGSEVGECKCYAWRLCSVVVACHSLHFLFAVESKLFGQRLCFSALSAQARVCWWSFVAIAGLLLPPTSFPLATIAGGSGGGPGGTMTRRGHKHKMTCVTLFLKQVRKRSKTGQKQVRNRSETGPETGQKQVRNRSEIG